MRFFYHKFIIFFIKVYHLVCPHKNYLIEILLMDKKKLEKLISLGKMTTKETAYGTKKRQKIGDSWKVNGKAFAAVYSNQNITIDPNRIEGEVTLVKALLVNNVPCLELNAQIKIAGIKLQGLPPNMRLLKNSITISDTLIRPVDVNRVGLRQTVEIKGNMEFEQDGMLTAVVSNEKGFGKRKSRQVGKGKIKFKKSKKEILKFKKKLRMSFKKVI